MTTESANQSSYATLQSAKYLIEQQAAEVEEVENETPVAPAAAPRGGLEQAFKWINPLVLMILVTVAGTWYWQNQESVASSAGRLHRRTSNPFNFLLWLKGSDYTAEDIVAESQRQFRSQMGNLNGGFSAEQFKPVDLQSQFNPSNFQGNWYQPPHAMNGGGHR